MSPSPQKFGVPLLVTSTAESLRLSESSHVVCLAGSFCLGKDVVAKHTLGALDDGRGRARVGLFRHKHEIETGRTSSVGMEVCIFLT